MANERVADSGCLLVLASRPWNAGGGPRPQGGTSGIARPGGGIRLMTAQRYQTHVSAHFITHLSAHFIDTEPQFLTTKHGSGSFVCRPPV